MNKDVNFFPAHSYNTQFISSQERKLSSNKENNFPELKHLCSESTTDGFFSKENSDMEDLEEIFYNKQGKNKVDKKASINEDFLKKCSIDDSKYKTEMCKNWEEKGRCNYGKKCKFAHGKHELIDKSLINKDRYKSKLCNSFHTIHFCLYGNRCLFIHNQNRKTNEILKQNYFKRNMNSLSFQKLINDKSTGKRCMFFQNLSNENQNLIEKRLEEFCLKVLENE